MTAILAFDTATAATTVALLEPAVNLVSEARDDPPANCRPTHATRLLALVETVLAEAGCGWEDVERLAVGIGPGTFTGLRIGIATAQALSWARGIPAVGISSLASLALGAQEAYPDRPTLAVIDARRGEAFAALWAAGAPAGAPPATGPSPLDPAALEAAAREPEKSPVAIGDGALKFRSVLEAAGASVPPDTDPMHRVAARHHCRLALSLRPVAARELTPVYLRVPDAELHRASKIPQTTEAA